MLKKLAKYGNSTTLVIDKAILELLNMNASSIVKLTTDGKSLIITPTSTIDKHEKISYSGLESIQAAGRTLKEKGEEQIRKIQKKDAQLIPNLQEEYKHLFKKYEKTLHQVNHSKSIFGQEYQDALENITQKFDPEKDSEAFMAEVGKLHEKLHPELADFNAEMKAVSEKYKEEFNQQFPEAIQHEENNKKKLK
ncbi:hypothetical protein JKY79_01530 [Candidatus Babeliales bacterium]|nr:hypothetical protein [Candidatus Babeliales bacterium]